MHAAGLVGSKLTVGHGGRVAHAWIGGCARSRRLRCPHRCHSRANVPLGHARTEMTTEEAPDQPVRWKWQKHISTMTEYRSWTMAAEPGAHRQPCISVAETWSGGRRQPAPRARMGCIHALGEQRETHRLATALTCCWASSIWCCDIARIPEAFLNIQMESLPQRLCFRFGSDCGRGWAKNTRRPSSDIPKGPKRWV
jgi:hypothetical protein